MVPSARGKTSGEDTPPSWASSFFTGVPAPVGALLVLAPLMLSLSPDINWPWLRHPAVGAAFLIGGGALMVSRLPTFSLKKGRIPPHLVLPIFLGIALTVGLLASSPWVTLPCLMLAYLATLPLSWRAYRRLEAADLAAQAAATQAPPASEAGRPTGVGIVELRPIAGGDNGERSRL